MIYWWPSNSHDKKEGISPQETKASITRLNDFVKLQPGFIARKTAVAEDGQFLDVVLWTDLASAKTASEKAMKNEDATKVFSIIDEKEMLFKHFEIFNSLE